MDTLTDIVLVLLALASPVWEQQHSATGFTIYE